MPTLYDLSRMMGGSGSRVGSTTPSRDASVGGVSGGQSGSSSSVRYGYALADSADGWVDVQLDTSQTIGGDSTVQCVCDSPISQGQRVAVDVMPNGQLKARPIGQNILDEAISDAAEKIQEAGQEILDSVNEDMAAVDAELEGVRGDVSAAQSAAQAAQSAADKAAEKADEAASQITDVKTAVEAAQSAADKAAEKADEAASQITDVKTAVEKDLDSIRTTVSGVSETADSALRQSSEAKQGLEGFKTTVSQTYETKADADAAMAQEVLDRNSAISQSATEIKQEVSQNYVSNETGETLATKAEVTQSANQIKQEVSQNYQVKGDYATSGELDDAIAKEVSDRNSAITQSATEIKQEVSENYVNNETGATLATKTELTTAIDGVKSTVSKNYLNKNDASKTYATKTEVTQSADSIKQEVSETYQVKGDYATDSDISSAIAQEVLDRNSAITQSANSIKQEVSENYVNNETGATLATKAELETTAQQITGKVDKVSETADSALRQSSEAIQKADEVSTSLTTNYVSKKDADTKYATKSLVQQTSDSILQQVSEDYQSAESASQMQSQIDQNAEAIRTEVTERKQAVTGAVKDAKSYTDQKADSISQTVEQEVMDEVGRTYATKTELTQTASGLELNITAAVDKADAAQGTANDAKGDAEDALNKANEVSSYFRADVTGLEIGQQGKPSSVKMNSAGAFQTLEDGVVVSQFAKDKIDLGLNSDASEVTMMGGTFHILAVSDGIAYGSKRLYLKPVDNEGPTGNPIYDLISLQISANTFLRFHATGTNGRTTAELASTDDMDITSYNGPLRIACEDGNTSISGDAIWMGTTGSIVKPGGMMGGNSVSQSLPSSNVTFDANSYYDCFTGDNAIGGNSAVFCRSDTITGNSSSIDDYMYIWLPKSKGSSPQPTPVLVSGMASAANVDNTNFAASLEVTRYSGSGSLMSQGTLAMGIQTGSSTGAFCTLTCPSALVMLGRSTSGPTVYRMRMMGRSSNGRATLQSWYMTAHLM